MSRENPQDGNVGNRGDMLKHAALVVLARALARARPAGPVNWLDVHAYQLHAPLANPAWSADSEALLVRCPACRDYVERERPWTAQGRYLCSTGLATSLMPGARAHLSERDPATREALRRQLAERGLTPVWLLDDLAGIPDAATRSGRPTALLALIDPFVLDADLWLAAMAGVTRLWRPGSPGLLLAFTSVDGGAPEWPSAPTGWGAPAATLFAPPFALAFYAAGGWGADLLTPLGPLGWRTRPAPKEPLLEGRPAPGPSGSSCGSSPALPPRGAKELGDSAESMAARHLERLGYRILARNVRSRYGELDLVAKHGETLVFCEVKARRGGSAGAPAEAIDRRKQARLERLAAAFLRSHPRWRDLDCRFDAVLLWKRGPLWRIDVIADAFRPGW